MNHLHTEINKLKTSLIEMLQLVKSQFEKSYTALIKNDKNLAREVIFNEKRVNAFELKIDKDCENIFALYTPVANDLRFVFATLKINTHLERIGDNAEGIAQFIVDLDNPFEEVLYEQLELKTMLLTCIDMIENIIIAYQNDDTESARQLFEKDQELNALDKKANEIIANHIKLDSTNIHNLLRLLILIRKLERTGDLTKSIAEEIIFYVEAKILRHGKNTLNDIN